MRVFVKEKMISSRIIWDPFRQILQIRRSRAEQLDGFFRKIYFLLMG